jgi:stage V sporulation protein S
MVSTVQNTTETVQHSHEAPLIRVSSASPAKSVAGAIAGVMREHRHAEVQAIGAPAVNQATKAIAIARGYLVDDQIDLFCIPSLINIEIDGAGRTAIHFALASRS